MESSTQAQGSSSRSSGNRTAQNATSRLTIYDGAVITKVLKHIIYIKSQFSIDLEETSDVDTTVPWYRSTETTLSYAHKTEIFHRISNRHGQDSHNRTIIIACSCSVLTEEILQMLANLQGDISEKAVEREWKKGLPQEKAYSENSFQIQDRYLNATDRDLIVSAILSARNLHKNYSCFEIDKLVGVSQLNMIEYHIKKVQENACFYKGEARTTN